MEARIINTQNFYHRLLNNLPFENRGLSTLNLQSLAQVLRREIGE